MSSEAVSGTTTTVLRDIAQASQRWPVTWYAGAAIALFLLCWMPTLFPVSPSVADSYMFGFNNRVALVLLLGLTATGAWLTQGFGMPLFPPEEHAGKSLPKRTLYCGLALAGAMCLLMWYLTHGLGGFTESTDLIDRVRLLAEGKRPYLDFEYAYGAGLLYGPLWTAKLLHLSIVNGYYLWWGLNCLFGVWLIYRVLDLAAYPTPRRKTIFWLLVVFGMQACMSTGVNYTWMRFALVPWFAVEAQHALCGRGGRRRFVAAGMVCAAGFVCTLLVSPEMGVAFLAGSLLWLAVCNREWTLDRVLGIGVTVLVGAVGIVAAAHFRYFELMRVMSGGGSNDPWMPALHLLLFFTCLGAAAAWLWYRWKARARWNDPLSAIVLVSLPTLASALGRCDPTHVLFGGVGITLAGMVLLSRTVLWRPAVAGFILAYFIFPAAYSRDMLLAMGKAVSHLVLSGDPQHEGPVMHIVERLAARKLGPEEAQRKIAATRRASNVPDEIDFDQVYSSVAPVLETPFPYLPNGFSRYHSPRIDEGRYFGLQNVLTPQQVQFKISELAAHPDRDLLLPQDFPQCGADPVAERKILTKLFFFPYYGHAVHPESIYSPVCDYIEANYRLAVPGSIETYRYALWKRR